MDLSKGQCENGPTVSFEKRKEDKKEKKKGSTMRRTMIFPGMLTILLVVIMQITFAQPRGQRPKMTTPEMVSHRMEKLDEILQLSDEQKQKIKPLLESHFAEMEKNRPSPDQPGKRGDFEKMRAEMDKKKSELNENISQVLSDEQRKIYIEFLKTDQPHRSPHGEPR